MKRIENLSDTLIQYQPGDATRYLFTYEQLPLFDGTTQTWCFSDLAPGFSFDSQQAIHVLSFLDFPPNEEPLWRKERDSLESLLASWWITDFLSGIHAKTNPYTILNGILCWEELRRQKRI